MDITNLKVEKVIDREKLASTLHAILDTGTELLNKEEAFGAQEYSKIKVIRTLG